MRYSDVEKQRQDRDKNSVYWIFSNNDAVLFFHEIMKNDINSSVDQIGFLV